MQEGTTFTSQQLVTGYLADVWGTADDNVYAVGEGGAIVHFDGTAWSKLTSPIVTTLNAVAGTSTNVFAVGDAGTILRYSPP